MSLTIGTGPFARPRQGRLNFDLDAAAPAHVLFLEDVPQRVRGVLADETVLDTRRAKRLHETGLLPQWYVPMGDIRPDVLTATAHRTHCPFKGDACYWTLSVGNQRRDDAVWSYPEPLAGAPPLAGLVAIPFEQLDRWYEEDEQVLGHPRDPYHRVDTRRSSQHVTVRVRGDVVAESSRPVKLFETSLPTRWYLPLADVHEGRLTPTDTTTVCPYKGVASYWSVGPARDVAWTYPEPLPEALATRGHVSFLGAQVQVEVDGSGG